VQGIWKVKGGKEGDVELNPSDGLADFGGKGKYSAPEYIWENVVGPTAIKFLDSNKIGKQYQNDMFVGIFIMEIFIILIWIKTGQDWFLMLH
jgi:aldose sugar dehydrogenase